jgi:gluconate 2-dehydrogenase gamma chain
VSGHGRAVGPASGLDPSRRLVLDALVERLLPADGFGAGARDAGVGGYVERALAGPYREQAAAYARALDAVEAYARTSAKCGFAALDPARQDEIVALLEQNALPGLDESDGPFFELLRRHTIEGMFGDPRWGGNAGGAGWALLGYPGPRLVWTEDDQRVRPLEEPAP